MRHRMRQTTRRMMGHTLGLLLAVGLGGCTWGGLDDLSKETPVRVYEKSESFTSPQFGMYMLVLQRPDDSRLPTIVVGGQYTTPAAALEIDSAGGVELTRIARVDTNEIAPHEDRKGNTIGAIVELSPVGDDARVLVASPEHDYVRWVRIPPADAADPDLVTGGMFHVDNASGGIRGFGGAIAAGYFDAAGGDQEWAIAADHNIFIVMNESENATDFEICPYPGPSISDYSSVTRALVAGRFTEDASTDTFVAGLPDDSAPYGSVRFITWTGSADCDGGYLVPPPTPSVDREEQYFGTALAAVDLNGDGVDDLIVGSPNKKDVPQTDSRVYVYLSTGSPIALTDTPSYIFESYMLHFGTKVAAMDVTGDGVPELMVGDPQASFEGNRGRAHLYEIAWTYNASPTTVTEEEGAIIGDTAEPTKMFGSDLKAATYAFGSSFAGLAWEPGSSRRELVVGAAGVIFGFYLTGLEGDDDRSAPDHDPRD